MTAGLDDRRLDPARPGAGAGRAADRRLAAGRARPPGLDGAQGLARQDPGRARRHAAAGAAAAPAARPASPWCRPTSSARACAQVSFKLEPGQALGVIGPSASGKSTLARTLAGIWRPVAGAVRLDAAELDHYGDDLGRYVGYLPQDIALFDGTVAENIARMAVEPDAEAVVAAAKKAGAHEMILRLPDGYDTQILVGGVAALRRPAPAHRARPRALRRPGARRARRAELQPRRRGRRGADARHPPDQGRRPHRHHHGAPPGGDLGMRPPARGARGRGAGLRAARRGAARAGAQPRHHRAASPGGGQGPAEAKK